MKKDIIYIHLALAKWKTISVKQMTPRKYRKFKLSTLPCDMLLQVVHKVYTVSNA